MGNNQIKQQYISDIKNNIEYDSYEIFNLKKNFSWNELKKSYKKLALKAHPDKGGDKILFDFITEKFYILANEYELRISNKNYNELKDDYTNYIQKNTNTSSNKYDDKLTVNERINKHFNDVCTFFDQRKNSKFIKYDIIKDNVSKLNKYIDTKGIQFPQVNKN